MRWWRFSQLIWALARSPSARDQLKHILARPPLPSPPEPPAGFIDVRSLIDTLSVEDLARTADEYFRQNDDQDVYATKPFTSADEAPDLLIGFSHVLSGLNPPRGSTVLDFGAGTGWSTRFLAQLGYAAIAMDVSARALELGRDLLQRVPVAGSHMTPRFLVFDGRRFDLPDSSVDRIMCLNAFHHVPNQQDVLKEMARVLRPGGIAGFSEPNAWHSRSAQAQYEMRHYTVVENDIVIEDIERWALAAGFARLELAVFDTRLYRVDRRRYEDLIAGGIAAQEYVDFVRQAASDRRAFFLHKAGAPMPDSRERKGLSGIVRVTFEDPNVVAGGEWRGEAEVTNTGANVWLPSGDGFGAVRIGVHLSARDGTLIDRDYARVDLPRSLAPRESARVRFAVRAPDAGEFRLVFDLVSEQVCWFEMNGSEVSTVDVTVGRA